MTPSSPAQSVAGFAAFLREHGFTIGIAEQAVMLEAALRLDVTSGETIDAAWRCIACHSARDWRRWRDAFDRYWWPQRVRGNVSVSGHSKPSRDLRQLVQSLQQQTGSQAPPRTEPASLAQSGHSGAAGADADAPGAVPRAQGGASRVEALHAREGSLWMPDQLIALQRIAARIVKRLQPRPTRRWRVASGGERLGLRATLRASVAWGGEPLSPRWLSKRHIPPRLFLLIDVSRSMESHGAFFLLVARAFAQAAGARVFVFHLGIAEVTELMQRDSPAIQEKVNAVVGGFAQGTRIAACLHEFLRRGARAQLGRGARVWIFSDGFDTDPPEQLAHAVHALRARGARMTWFHPTRQAPKSTALGLARNAIDCFIPLASIIDLAAAERLLR